MFFRKTFSVSLRKVNQKTNASVGAASAARSAKGVSPRTARAGTEAVFALPLLPAWGMQAPWVGEKETCPLKTQFTPSLPFSTGSVLI